MDPSPEGSLLLPVLSVRSCSVSLLLEEIPLHGGGGRTQGVPRSLEPLMPGMGKGTLMHKRLQGEASEGLWPQTGFC